MKTASQLTNTINALSGSQGYIGKNMKSLNKEIRRLTLLRNFLETNPDQQYLQNQLSELKKRKARIESGFPAWNTIANASLYNRKGKSLYSAYKTEMGLPGIYAQIKNLEFLLD